MIWIDLDNTLIYTIDSFDRLAEQLKLPSAARSEPNLEIVSVGDAKEQACVRPFAQEFLAGLRALQPVCMLTTATRAYAQAMNAHFALGFEPGAIVAREDWMEFPLARMKVYRPNKLGVDAAGILIDDDDETIHCRMKLVYLGCRVLVTVPVFRGSDFDPFSETWVELLSTVAEKLARKSTRKNR